jgi:gluconate kinase
MDLIYTHEVEGKSFTLNTKEIKKMLEGISINNIDVLAWLKSYIEEGLEELRLKEGAHELS